MSKVVEYGDVASSAVVKGIDAVANIVKTTIGPRGRNVLVRNQISPPIITNDGVTIAKSIQLKDNIEDAGAQLIIQAANKTNDVAGDGTTTTTVLAQEMIHSYYKAVVDNEADSFNPVTVQKDMIKASKEISDFLLSKSVKVESIEDIKKIASISSGSDETGELIANAFEAAGEYGSVIVEESKSGFDNLVSIEGMKLSNGSVSQFLLNDRAKMKTDMYDVSLLVTTDKIDSVPDLFSVLDKVIPSGRKLLIICDEMELEPLNMLAYNKAQGKLPNIGVITLPGFGQLREDLVEDICVATGATLMGRDNGISLRDFDLSYLGDLEQVVITMEDTILKFKETSLTGENLLEIRQEKAKELTITMEEANESDKEQYKRRISNLISGISIIEVGGNSQVEIEDKKLRIEDAINSVQSAKEEGIVPGGGYSFLQAYMNVAEQGAKQADETGVGIVMTLGETIVYEALKSITRQIAENGGYNGDTVVNNCFRRKLGFNALTGNYENLAETGVINSVKVDRYSVINAVSVASTVITMGGVIVEENEKDQNILQLQGPLPAMM